MRPWMIYGANGYTGELTAREARRRGLAPILAGRNEAPIRKLGEEIGLETRVFALDDADVVARNLQGVDAVLNCAGPFSATSRKMLAGCIKSKTHYLDITGEISVFEDVHSRNDEFKSAGIIAMPGVGFDVVPSDCLAAMLKREMPSATHLKLAFKSLHGKLSPGTTKTMMEGLPEGGKIRRDGEITRVPATYKVEEIPFVDKPESAVTIPWGDVSTAYYSTGIPNIEVFMGASPRRIKQMRIPAMARWFLGLPFVQARIKKKIARTVKGPNEAERARDRMFLYGEAWNGGGMKVAMRMQTPEGYNLTVDSSIAAVAKLLETNLPPGAYTPSKAFGPDFVTTLNGVQIQKVE